MDQYLCLIATIRNTNSLSCYVFLAFNFLFPSIAASIIFMHCILVLNVYVLPFTLYFK